ncbi:hypothetical protein HMPREF9944_02324, partial [Segatella maculosa OT 289]
MPVSKFCLTFVAVKQNSVTYRIYIKGVTPMQRNFDFSASFNAYYLVNPNNLLTHTHTHT